MSHHVDPDVMYRIRSRGVERPAVEGHRLPQLVRDFLLARHDELSEDGQFWFPASEVESLFPSAANARFIRERQKRDPGDQPEEYQAQVEDDRKFPRDPWYVARASNVAGPYDQMTITQWYEEGCLRDDDQLRPGLNTKWRPLAVARSEGLLSPPAANTCSVNPIHLVADPPVWMGPPTSPTLVSEEWMPATQHSGQLNTNVPLVLASVAAAILFLVSLAGLAWFIINLERREPDSADTNEQVTSRPTQNVTGSMPSGIVAPSKTASLLVPLSDQQVAAGERIEIALLAVDPFRQADLGFDLKSAPATATINGDTLTWTPAQSDAGQTHSISVQVTDEANRDRVEVVSFKLQVVEAFDPFAP